MLLVSGRFPGVGHVTCSSIFAWKTLWTEEPGGLYSMGSQDKTAHTQDKNRHIGCCMRYRNLKKKSIKKLDKKK